MITGRTRLAAVIGHPVAHSLSPALHNAAFQSLGLDWVYLAFEVAPGRADDALTAMRTLALGGLSVTMPHKHQVARSVDTLAPAAAALDSVNTVVRDTDGRLVGHSTDGDGFVASLRAAGHDVDARRVCVLGAGGAARSIIDALARAGAARIDVVNRTASSAEAAAALGHGRAFPVALGPGNDVAGAADVIVNATSVGMHSRDLPCEPDVLHAGQVVADIVYQPLRTALLDAAAARGAATVDGLGMLVHQAVLQQELWHGTRPSIEPMYAAALAELATRTRSVGQ